MNIKHIKKSYAIQRNNAKQRGIAWEFTFDSWLKKWEDSGKLSLRGNTKEKPYVMCRYGDVGPYSYDNTRIDTRENNSKETMKIRYQNHVYPIRSNRQKGRPFDTGKEIIINEITYPTITKAAEALGINRTTLVYRLKINYYK
jgi:hypothetical protein